jgi:hypothetical protein
VNQRTQRLDISHRDLQRFHLDQRSIGRVSHGHALESGRPTDVNLGLLAKLNE